METIISRLDLLVLTTQAVGFIFTLDILLLVVILLALILCSGLVSGSEVAFFSIKGQQFTELADSEHAYHKVILRLLETPRRLLGTILIANNFINISIVILFTLISSSVFDFQDQPVLAFLVNVVAITFILVVLGEVIPKVYANRINVGFAAFMSYPLFIMDKAFYPLSALLVRFISTIERNISTKKPDVSLEDLKEAIEITAHEKSDNNDKKMLRGIVNFSNITVKQVMTSRVDTVAYTTEAKLSEMIKDINEHRYSRIPVYEETFDNIKGILYIKDLAPYLHEGDNFNWLQLLRKPYIVPENKKIDDLLREFQSKKVHMAVVVDEYGGTSGIITMEDILEEIVGEIQDEFDVDEIYYSKLNEQEYVFDAKTALHDLTRILEIADDTFEPYKNEVESLGGLMIELFGRVPQPRESIDYKNLSFTIESADRKRVRKVKVAISEKPEEIETA